MAKCIKSKKVLEYQKELQKSIEPLSMVISALRNKLDKSSYNSGMGSLEDYTKEMNDVADKVYLYERSLQQALAELGDEVYINVYKDNTITQYEVVEMLTPRKWMIKEVGKDDVVAIYKGTKTNNFTLKKCIGVVTAAPLNV